MVDEEMDEEIADDDEDYAEDYLTGEESDDLVILPCAFPDL